MNKTFKKIVTLTLLLSSMASVCACGGSSAKSDGKTNVRIAYFPNITHTQALVMKNKKTLEDTWKDKCNVSWKSFNAGPEETEALFAGQIDLGYIGPVPAVSANSKSKGDIQIISNACNAGAVLLVRKNSNISSVADLAGKTIAVPQLGNTQHLCLLNLMAENGLKTIDEGGDVTVSASANADIVNLFDAGSIDAALVPEPWGTTIEKKGNADILLDANQIFSQGDYPTAVVVATKDFMTSHPDLVEDFLKAHQDATLFINENTVEAQEIVNKEIDSITQKSLDSDVLSTAFSRLYITSTLNKDAIMQFAQISKNEGFITEVPEEANVFKTTEH